MWAFALIALLISLTVTPSSSTVIPSRFPSNWQSTGALHPSTPHTIFVSLPYQNVAELELVLSRVSDPAHSLYGQWLSSAEVTALIAPPSHTVEVVRRWLVSGGVPEAHITAHGTAFEVVTSVGVVNALFNTTLHRYEQQGKGKGRGRAGVVAHGSVTVPEEVLPHIAMILGVQNLPFPLQHQSIKVTPRSLTPSTSRFHPHADLLL